MTDDASRLNALTGSVSDGQTVDWERAESGAEDPAEQARIRALHDVSRIADFNRGIQRAPRPAGADASGPGA